MNKLIWFLSPSSAKNTYYPITGMETDLGELSKLTHAFPKAG